MAIPEKDLLEVLEERASLLGASCTREAGFFTRLSAPLRTHYAERYEQGDEAYRAEFRQQYPHLAGEFEKARMAG